MPNSTVGTTVAAVQSVNCNNLNVQEGNRMAVATAVFGCLSVVVCLCVLAVILGYKKDRYAFRERILFGLMCANIVYAAANIAPVWYSMCLIYGLCVKYCCQRIAELCFDSVCDVTFY